MKYRTYWKKSAFFAAVLLLVLTVLYGGLRFLETAVLSPGLQSDREIVSRTIIRDGIEYYPRRDITVILMLGIGGSDSAAGAEQGRLDAVRLLIFDEKNETWSMLHLSCDTMLEIPVPDGESMGAEAIYDRLALAYTYGSDPEDRCINTRKAISDFLGGIAIDYYVAVRMDVIDGMEDPSGRTVFDSLREVYSAASDLVTDCPVQTMISMGTRYQHYQFAGVFTPEGKHAADEENAGFCTDKDKLDELVIELFYAPKPGQ